MGGHKLVAPSCREISLIFKTRTFEDFILSSIVSKADKRFMLEANHKGWIHPLFQEARPVPK